MKKNQPSKLSFSDIGLSTALPECLTKTAAEKHLEKLQQRKAKEQRVREAQVSLSSSTTEIQRHRDFVAAEKQAAAAEKCERKRALKAEHIQAQNQRLAESKLREQSLVEQQTKISHTVQETIRTQEKRERKLQKLLRAQDEKAARAAPPPIHVPVHRREEIESTRAELPVLREEQAIVEAVNESKHHCVLICGETGSGKTTQVPQFLWECGYAHPVGAPAGREGMMVVTEPRRVAAVAMAQRVADELNEPFGGTVCYHVRYDNNVSEDCKLKFVTEGILLKEVQSDFLLRRYSVVIVDEAHERSVAGDILVGLLSRIVPLRRSLAAEHAVVEGNPVHPLRLIVMSATLCVSDYRDNRRLFPHEPPLLNVEARRFPVTCHFAKRTELRRYCDEAFRKVTHIHKKLPPGGILVFLCTQREIESMVERLRRHYRKTRIFYDASSYRKHSMTAASAARDQNSVNQPEVDDYGLDEGQYKLAGDEGYHSQSNTLADFGLRDDFDYHHAQGSVDSDGDEDGRRQVSEDVAEEEDAVDGGHHDAVTMENEDEEDGQFNSLHVLPLYALLNFDEQQRVFIDPPPGKRLCVVATNVAETSITIPGIRYVVDCGRVKAKTLDESSGASSYSIQWTSQASAEQRSGRAGRTSPGHCYRLFSTAVYTNLMPAHTLPEILRTPIEAVVLLMKSFGIDHVGNFPFPTPPKAADVEMAIRHLLVLGALDKEHLRITPLGRQLLRYPVAPRLAKMIVTAASLRQERLRVIILNMVALCATTLDLFESGAVQSASRKQQLPKEGTSSDADVRTLLHAGSDFITFLNAMGVFSVRPTLATTTRFRLVHKAITEAVQLRQQLFRSDVREEDDSLVVQQEGGDTNNNSLETNIDDKRSRGLQGRTGGGSAGSVGAALSCFDAKGKCVLAKDEEIMLRKLIAVGLVDQVARRASVHECRSRGAAYTDGKASKVPYLDIRTSTLVFIHPSSTVACTVPPPDFVTYCGLQRSSRRISDPNGNSSDSAKSAPRTFMKGVTVVTKGWLDELGFDEQLLSDAYSRPLGDF